MFDSNNFSPHIQRQNNAIGLNIGFDLLNKHSPAAVSAIQKFVTTQPPQTSASSSLNVVRVSPTNSSAISSPPLASIGSASFGNAVFFHGLKMPCRMNSPPSLSSPKCRAKSSSPSPNRQQQKHRNGSLMSRPNGCDHRRRAVHHNSQKAASKHGRHGTVAAASDGQSADDATAPSAAATTTTIRYNYAYRKDYSEKTPMCRLAELARANHLKHAYVLLDESGPAHCKQFVVKLVLRPGLEFEGSGPSIKKAQQSAAQAALDRSCQLPLRQPMAPSSMASAPPLQPPPPLSSFGDGTTKRTVPSTALVTAQLQRRQHQQLLGGVLAPRRMAGNGRRADDTKNPVCLLNSVAAQLGFSLRYREECLSRTVNSNVNLANPPLLAYFLPQSLCPSATAQCAANGPTTAAPIFANLPPHHQRQQQQQQQNETTRFQPPHPPPFGSPPLKCLPPSQPPAAPTIQPTVQLGTAQNGAVGLLPNPLMVPPPSLALANPLSAAVLFSSGIDQQMQHFHHRHQILSIPTANGRHVFPFTMPQSNGPNQQAYKVTVRLSKDGTEHTATGPTLTTAKQKAATLALAHLRPELEQLKRLLQNGGVAEEAKRERVVPKQEAKLDQQWQRNNDGDAVTKCHSPSSSSSDSIIAQQRQRHELDDEPATALAERVPMDDGTEKCCFAISANKNAADLDGDGADQSGASATATTTTTTEPTNVAGDDQSPVDKLHQQKTPPHKKYKSVVSQIHECALQLRMNVEFEVVAEFGEPHNRTYTVSVRLFSPLTDHQQYHHHHFISGMMEGQGQQSEFVADGQGLSKKAAKQAACQKLLSQVKHLLELDPIQLASSIVHPSNNGIGWHGPLRRATNSLARGETAAAAQHQQQPKLDDTTTATTPTSNNKRKTIIKDKKMDPNYGTGVNPISRLIQVMQARGERDPLFQVIGEHGQNRHKEFTVSVQCMGEQEQGTGPNKKLAKRAAAEAMLAKIGYVKPMPQPGKSLLKKSASAAAAPAIDNGIEANCCFNDRTTFELPSTPEKVPMPTIDMFVLPPSVDDSPDDINATADHGTNKPFIEQKSLAPWNLQEEEWEEDDSSRSNEVLALAPQKREQTVPKALETFADVEQQCFSATSDKQLQQQQQHRCVDAVQQKDGTVNNSDCDDDQRLKWVNPPLQEMGADCYDHGHGHAQQQLHYRHRSADDENSVSSLSELGSGTHSPDNNDADDTPSSSHTVGAAHRRRRVTFSDTVRACPPPGAAEADSVAPLKSELCTKPRRRLRPFSKDSQRVLSADETKRLTCATALFLAWPTVETEKCGLTLLRVSNDSPSTRNCTTTTTTTTVISNHGANDEAEADVTLVVDDAELLDTALQTVDNVGTNNAALLLDDHGTVVASSKSMAVPTVLLNSLGPTVTPDSAHAFHNSNRLLIGNSNLPPSAPPGPPTTLMNLSPSVNFNLAASMHGMTCPNTMALHTTAMPVVVPPPAAMVNISANNNNCMASSPSAHRLSAVPSPMNCLNRMAFAATHFNMPTSAVAPMHNKNCLNFSSSSSPPQMAMPPPAPVVPPAMFSVPPPAIVPTANAAAPQQQQFVSPASAAIVLQPPPPTSFPLRNTKKQLQKFKLIEAKQFLEKVASVYNFTVMYSDFPKTRNDANEEQCFSLVTLGFAKPIVCPGSGPTKQMAHNDAALNAIRKCNNPNSN